VQGDNPIVTKLPLNTKSVAAGVRCGEMWIDCYWKVAGLENIVRERAERTPEPRHASCRVCGGEESAWTQTGELLDIVYVDRDISGNRHGPDVFQVIDSKLGRHTRGTRAQSARR